MSTISDRLPPVSQPSQNSSSSSSESSHVAGPSAYEAFAASNAFRNLTTEESNPLTEFLSDRAAESLQDTIDDLHKVDEAVLHAFDLFTKNHLPYLAENVASVLRLNKKVVFAGCGTSGRVAVDLAAKSGLPNVRGVIGGGGSAMFRAVEGVEDSEEKGAEAARNAGIEDGDIVFLISASGTARYNVGFAREAKARGAIVFYFFNNGEIPTAAKPLFENEVAEPVQVAMPPPSIRGSTRLQPATEALLCFGSVLSYAKMLNEGHAEPCIKGFFESAKVNLAEIHSARTHHHDKMAHAAFLIAKTLGSGKQITLITTKNTARLGLTLATEMPPTFSFNPPRRKGEEQCPPPEILSYLVGCSDNNKGWLDLTRDEELADAGAAAYCYSQNAVGLDSYESRSKGPGDLVIAIAREGADDLEALSESLNVAKTNGAFTMLIWASQIPFDHEALFSDCDARVLLDFVPPGFLEMSETVTLKMALDDIFNSAMGKMDKLLGNWMIDVNPSNDKLFVRTFKLILSVFNSYSNKNPNPDKEAIYNLLNHVKERFIQDRRDGKNPPSVAKTVVVMFEKAFSYDEAVEFLKTNPSLKSIFA